MNMNENARPVDVSFSNSKLMNATLAFALILMAAFILMAGQSVLIPFAISLLLWFIINALSSVLQNRLIASNLSLPGWLSMTLALLIVFAACIGLAEIVAASGQAMIERLPLYAGNISVLTDRLALVLGSDFMSQILSAIEGFDFEKVLIGVTNTAAGLLGSIGTVVLYVAFLLVEQRFMAKKIAAMTGSEKRSEDVRRIIDTISTRIRTYLFTKSLTSAAMAGVVWVFLIIAGVDFAGFWAFLVFILNFIPVVGGIVSGVFPALLALIQFPTFGPFLIVIAGVAIAHLVIGNIVEPRFVGSSVNLSPLVVILALAIWGFIWGIPGMFLCVPLTVIAMIILAEFKSTRPFAIALSENGELNQN